MTRTVFAMAFIMATVVAHAADYRRSYPLRELPSCYEGLVRQGYYWFWAEVPIACRVPGGTILTGPGQSPNCGGGPGMYPCSRPIYIPDNAQ